MKKKLKVKDKFTRKIENEILNLSEKDKQLQKRYDALKNKADKLN